MSERCQLYLNIWESLTSSLSSINVTVNVVNNTLTGHIYIISYMTDLLLHYTCPVDSKYQRNISEIAQCKQMERWRDGEMERWWLLPRHFYILTFCREFDRFDCERIPSEHCIYTGIHIHIPPVSTKEEFGFRANYVSSNYINDIWAWKYTKPTEWELVSLYTFKPIIGLQAPLCFIALDCWIFFFQKWNDFNGLKFFNKI